MAPGVISRKSDTAIADDLHQLMLIPGLSGHEYRVRQCIAALLHQAGVESRTDRLGNLIATLPGLASAPSVMLIAHMDQLGFIVRKIEPDGLIRIERLGGVPEKALAAQPVLLCVGEGKDVPGIIATKSHHATSAEEKYVVVPYGDAYVDAGFSSAASARAAGVDIGTPVVYRPRAENLANGRVAGTSIDDRAGCAVQVEIARRLAPTRKRPTVHLVFSVQEEFNLRGALAPAQTLKPDMAMQIDLILAHDTPDMASQGEVRIGSGPVISLYSFHGRGTLNGTLPHPALVALFANTAERLNMPLQRSAHVGALTETSYVQLVGEGIATIDVGFPCRYTHSPNEVCDLADLVALAQLIEETVLSIDTGFSLDRNEYPQ